MVMNAGRTNRADLTARAINLARAAHERADKGFYGTYRFKINPQHNAFEVAKAALILHWDNIPYWYWRHQACLYLYGIRYPAQMGGLKPIWWPLVSNGSDHYETQTRAR